LDKYLLIYQIQPENLLTHNYRTWNSSNEFVIIQDARTFTGVDPTSHTWANTDGSSSYKYSSVLGTGLLAENVALSTPSHFNASVITQSGAIKVRVAPKGTNTSSSNYEETLNVTVDGQSYGITLKQPRVTPTFNSLSPTSLAWAYDGTASKTVSISGSNILVSDITVNTLTNFDVAVTNASTITVTPKAKNKSAYDKVETLEVAIGGVTKTVSLTQYGTSAEIRSVSPMELVWAFDNIQQKHVTIQGRRLFEGTLITYEPLSSHFYISKINYDATNGYTAGIHLKPTGQNNTYDDIVSEFQFKSRDSELYTIRLVHQGKTQSIAISPTTATIAYGASQSFTVSGGFSSYTYECTSEYVTIVKNGNTLTVTNNNPDSSDQSCTLTVTTGNEQASASASITLSRQGSTYTGLNPASHTWECNQTTDKYSTVVGSGIFLDDVTIMTTPTHFNVSKVDDGGTIKIKCTPKGTNTTSTAYSETVSVKVGSVTKSITLTQNGDSVQSYGNVVIDSYTYNPSSVSAAAGATGQPVLTYHQDVTYKSGNVVTYTGTGNPDKFGVSFSNTSSVSGFSINGTTGVISYPSYTGTSSRTYTVSVHVTGQNGKYADKSFTLTQNADSVTSYENPVVTLSYPDIAYNSTSVVSPTLTVKQTYNYASGRTQEVTLSSGEYTVNSYSGSAAGFTLNTSTGKVTPTSNAGAAIAARDEYGTPVIKSFSYDDIAYTGGSSSPTITYEQTKTAYGSGRNSTSSRSINVTVSVTAHSKPGSGSGSATQAGDEGVTPSSTSSTLTSGATVTYSGSATGFTLNNGTVTATSNAGTGGGVTYDDPVVTFTSPSSSIAYTGGSITCNAATYSQKKTTAARNATSSRYINVTATVKMNGKDSEQSTVRCTQKADAGTAVKTEYITSGYTVGYTSSGTGFSNNLNVITASSNKGSDFTEYSGLSVTEFSYDKAKASGATVTPVVTVSRVKTTGRRSTGQREGQITASVTMNGKTGSKSITIVQGGDSGTSESSSEAVTGFTKSFSTVTDHSGATLNTSTGAVTWSAYTGTTSDRSEKEKITVTYDGKTATKEATSVQSKKNSWSAGDDDSGSGTGESGNY